MDRTDCCRRIAREAGALAHTGFGRSGVSMKGRHDVLTEMDGKVERFIRDAIAAQFPDDAVLGEEGGASGSASAGHLWVVDPIDGTANYARGIAHYCVSIGVLERAPSGWSALGWGTGSGTPQAGVSGSPSRRKSSSAPCS